MRARAEARPQRIKRRNPRYSGIDHGLGRQGSSVDQGEEPAPLSLGRRGLGFGWGSQPGSSPLPDKRCKLSSWSGRCVRTSTLTLPFSFPWDSRNLEKGVGTVEEEAKEKTSEAPKKDDEKGKMATARRSQKE